MDHAREQIEKEKPIPFSRAKSVKIAAGIEIETPSWESTMEERLDAVQRHLKDPSYVKEIKESSTDTPKEGIMRMVSAKRHSVPLPREVGFGTSSSRTLPVTTGFGSSSSRSAGYGSPLAGIGSARRLPGATGRNAVKNASRRGVLTGIGGKGNGPFNKEEKGSPGSNGGAEPGQKLPKI
jgi:hypothetical protein